MHRLPVCDQRAASFSFLNAAELAADHVPSVREYLAAAAGSQNENLATYRPTGTGADRGD